MLYGALELSLSLVNSMFTWVYTFPSGENLELTETFQQPVLLEVWLISIYFWLPRIA